jgi:peptidyl-prolyl cis-trans isomerase B (cyclophilin B)
MISKKYYSHLSRKSAKAFLALWLLLSGACGHRKPTLGETKQNHFFAEILRRESGCSLGQDGFFEKNLLSNPDSKVRQWCAISLGRIGDCQALPWLFAGLHAGDAMLRAASAFAIGEIEDRELLEAQHLSINPRTIPELSRLLDDPSLLVQTRAVEALGRTGSHSEAVGLAERLDRYHFQETPGDLAYLDASLTALTRMNDPAANPIIQKFASFTDPEIHRRALNALARLREKTSHPQSLPALAADTLGSAQIISPGSTPGSSPTDASPGISSESLSDAVCLTLAASRKNNTIATVETTQGNIEIDLFREDAPVATAKFISMANLGAFEGLRFAHSIPFSLIQTDEPRFNAGPGRKIVPEINMHPFERGSVGISLAPTNAIAGQFFITLTPQPEKDGLTTCFGRVVSGMQAVEKIGPGDSIKKVRIKEILGFLRNRRY